MINDGQGKRCWPSRRGDGARYCGPGARDMKLVSVNSVSTSAAEQSVCGGEALRGVQKMGRLSFVSAPAPNRRQMETVPGWQRESLDGVRMVLYHLALSSHGRVPLSNHSRSRRLLARLNAEHRLPTPTLLASCSPRSGVHLG